MELISIQELDRLERQIAGQRKIQSLRLLDRYPQSEKVILCLYENSKSGLFIKHDDINFIILTNFRIMVARNGIESQYELMLNKYDGAKLRQDMWSLSIDLYNPTLGIWVFEKKDLGPVEQLANELNKAISHAKVLSRSTTVTINPSAASGDERIADQLRKLADLHAQGILTDEEFSRAKQRIIG